MAEWIKSNKSNKYMFLFFSLAMFVSLIILSVRTEKTNYVCVCNDMISWFGSFEILLDVFQSKSKSY